MDAHDDIETAATQATPPVSPVPHAAATGSIYTPIPTTDTGIPTLSGLKAHSHGAPRGEPYDLNPTEQQAPSALRHSTPPKYRLYFKYNNKPCGEVPAAGIVSTSALRRQDRHGQAWNSRCPAGMHVFSRVPTHPLPSTSINSICKLRALCTHGHPQHAEHSAHSIGHLHHPPLHSSGRNAPTVAGQRSTAQHVQSSGTPYTLHLSLAGAHPESSIGRGQRSAYHIKAMQCPHHVYI